MVDGRLEKAAQRANAANTHLYLRRHSWRADPQPGEAVCTTRHSNLRNGELRRPEVAELAQLDTGRLGIPSNLGLHIFQLGGVFTCRQALKTCEQGQSCCVMANGQGERQVRMIRHVQQNANPATMGSACTKQIVTCT